MALIAAAATLTQVVTATTNVDKLLTVLYGSALQIQLLADDWYTVTAEYVSQVEMLRQRVDTYNKHGGMYGDLPEEGYMVKVVRRAIRLLQIEEMKVKKLDDAINNGGCWGVISLLYAKLHMISFPQRVERIIKKVTTELDMIPKRLKMEIESADLHYKFYSIQPITTKRNNSGFYVPIQKTQSKVTEVLNLKEGTHSVVLLHGGVGKGKSVLASDVCELYGKDKERFENVFFLDCGNVCEIPDPSTKLQRVLQNLAPSMVGGEGKHSDDRIEANLRAFLRERKILIILDNILDSSFLQKIWAIRGENVKYLVTSQKMELCDNIPKEHRFIIHMPDPSKDEAREILASLVGLGGQKIPDNLLDIANQLIEATGGNPLALACLARSFSSGDEVILDRKRWEHAYGDLRKLLDKPGTKSVHEGTSISLWTAMKLSIDSLRSEDAKILLFLMCACEGTSAVEEVLQVLFERMKSSSGTFFEEMEQLETRELVKRNPERKPGNRAPGTRSEGEDQDQYLQESTLWSLRSLVKLYMQDNVVSKDGMTPVIDLLRRRETIENSESKPLRLGETTTDLDDVEKEENEKDRVAAALCDLYFDRTQLLKFVREREKNRTKAAITVNDLEINLRRDPASDGKSLRRSAIEPLIRLLVQPSGENWTEFHQRGVRKVFLEYICKDRLEVEGISDLLQLIEYPPAPLETLRAVREICRIESLLKRNSLLKERPERIFEALADLLDKVHKRIQKPGSKTKEESIQYDQKKILYLRLQEETCKALVALSWKAVEENPSNCLNWTPRFLETLQRLLHGSNGSHSLQVDVAQTLWILLLQGKENVQGAVGINNQDGAPGSSVSLLSIISNLLKPAAELNNENREGVPRNLEKILSDRDKPDDLCEPAVEALYSLACGLDPLIIKNIVDADWVLLRLVRALTNDDQPHLQIWAANVLGLLASGPKEGIRLKLLNQEGLLDGLVRSLAQGAVQQKNNYLRERAASALANLAMGEDAEPRRRIVGYNNLLPSLAESLFEDNRGLQERAARAIGNLALGCPEDEEKDWEIVKKITDYKRSVAGLVKLSEGRTSRLSEVANKALKNLRSRVNSKTNLNNMNERANSNNVLKRHHSEISDQGCQVPSDKSIPVTVVNHYGSDDVIRSRGCERRPRETVGSDDGSDDGNDDGNDDGPNAIRSRRSERRPRETVGSDDGPNAIRSRRSERRPRKTGGSDDENDDGPNAIRSRRSERRPRETVGSDDGPNAIRSRRSERRPRKTGGSDDENDDGPNAIRSRRSERRPRKTVGNQYGSDGPTEIRWRPR